MYLPPVYTDQVPRVVIYLLRGVFLAFLIKSI